MKRSIVALAVASFCLVSAAIARKGVQPRIEHDIAVGHKPKLAASINGKLHVVYEGIPDVAKHTNIYYRQSTDGGATWSKEIDISRSTGTSSDPDLTTESDGSVDVAWKDTRSGADRPDVFYTHSADGGTNWTDPADISNTSGVSSEPAIAAGPDNSLHVVWIDTTSGPTHPDVYCVDSSNAGKTWSKPEDISNTPGVSREPEISVGPDGAVHVVWADTTPGVTRPDIYYVRRSDGSWTKPADVSKSIRFSAHPCVATGPKSRVYLCWQDNSKKQFADDIWCAVAGKSGKWAKPLNISDTPGVSSEPCLAADQSGRLGIVWSDTTTGLDRPDICTRVSLDSGSDFSNQLDLSNSTTGKSKHPDVALSGSIMHVVWEEIAGASSTIKVTSMDLKGTPTGPAEEVEPTTHGRSM